MRGTLTILGSGTSTGVPVPGCSCRVCLSGKARNNRTRTSAYLAIPTKDGATTGILIDTSADFRAQALRERLPRIDAVLYTHHHSDHTIGLEDLRGYNFLQKGPIPVYGTPETMAQIASLFRYIFEPDPSYLGAKVTEVTVHHLSPCTPFFINGVTIQPFPLLHGNIQVLGFRFSDLAYATDCNAIPAESREILRGVTTMIIDGLRFEPHAAHFTIPQAIAAAREIGARRIILTHTTHTIDYDEVSAQLPPDVSLAYDGMTIEVA